MLSTSATLTDAQTLAKAVQTAQGHVPKPLANIPLAGVALLNAPSPTPDPARAIVEAAQDGTLTEDTLATLITTAAQQQMVATYRGELRRNQGLFVGAFFTTLQSGAADELLDSLR